MVHTSVSGRGVVQVPTALIAGRGKPGLIVSDHSAEVNSRFVLAWSEETGVFWHFIARDKPMQNSMCEAFNSTRREELLNETLLFGLDHFSGGAGRLPQAVRAGPYPSKPYRRHDR